MLRHAFPCATLQGLSDNMGPGKSLEAMDDFLSRYSKAQTKQAERTVTPSSMRINTPGGSFTTAKHPLLPSMPPSSRPLLDQPGGGIKPPTPSRPYGGIGSMARPNSTGVTGNYKPSSILAAAATSRAQSANGNSGGRSQVFEVSHAIDSLDAEMAGIQAAAALKAGQRSRPDSGVFGGGGIRAPSPAVPRSPMLASPYAGSRGSALGQGLSAGRPPLSPLLGGRGEDGGGGGGQAVAESRDYGTHSINMLGGSLKGDSAWVAAN